MHQDATLYGGKLQWAEPRQLCVRWGPNTPSQKGRNSQFLALVYCGQTAVCIRIPLDVELGLGPADIVLDGDPAPPPLKGHNPQFSANVHCDQTA